MKAINAALFSALVLASFPDWAQTGFTRSVVGG
jgi:hypothetical protein